ncbi:MAG TPA: peptidoglycan DD-metalloendopeptidase family protein [Hyphomonadaceae bacterium]|nr:peptidoglycan DD-metalloendopeptidase family protein [Hyphomonadaceae bacterium]HPN06283.1 peptidoglycan DD-metalloendopeptidase family protein [Hyphomonadaceae bacterium]
MSREAFDRWIASLRPTGIEVIEGLGKGVAGKLGDTDVKHGEPVRFGGYGEDRSIYTQTLFAPEGDEPRTVHLGIDVFAPADTAVYTPLNARVHSSRINDAEGDYGPTIILEHTPVAGLKFHTLYGHLDRDSLKGLKPGTAFMAGEKIAQLGTRRENGGWSPHLHFQIILDIGSAKGDYPGVAKRSEQDKWLAICPDPAKLLGRA